MNYEDIIIALEDIVRGEGDETLNISNFLQRIMANIEANGKDFTAMCYDLPISLVNVISEYMEKA